jgi:hypothetical protein
VSHESENGYSTAFSTFERDSAYVSHHDVVKSTAHSDPIWDADSVCRTRLGRV